jgi:hypothetical protein
MRRLDRASMPIRRHDVSQAEALHVRRVEPGGDE